MPWQNGKLPDSALAAIPGGRLEKNAAASWLQMREYIGKEEGIWICPTSSRTAYRTYAEQEYFWDLYQHHGGNLAAKPGQSNHGWGLAVDVPYPNMAAAINKHGAKFGWQKKWSDAPGEWWHFKYAPEHDTWTAPPAKPHTHPIHYLTGGELYWRNVLVTERRSAKRHGGWDKIDHSHLVRAQIAKKHLREKLADIDEAVKDDRAKGIADARTRNHRVERRAYLKTLIGA